MAEQPKSQRGEKDGVPGTWYTETLHGGPGNYPYEHRWFVSDADAAKIDTRYSNERKET